MDFYKLAERNKDSDDEMECEIYDSPYPSWGLYIIMLELEKQNSENREYYPARFEVRVKQKFSFFIKTLYYGS